MVLVLMKTSLSLERLARLPCFQAACNSLFEGHVPNSEISTVFSAPNVGDWQHLVNHKLIKQLMFFKKWRMG